MREQGNAEAEAIPSLHPASPSEGSLSLGRSAGRGGEFGIYKALEGE